MLIRSGYWTLWGSLGARSAFYILSEAKCKRTRERGAEHSRLLSCATLAWLLATPTPPNGELARGLSLRLRVRLSRCHVELHYGTVLGTLSQLLLVIAVLRRWVGQELLSPKTAPWYNSTLSFAKNRRCESYRVTSSLWQRRNHERDCKFFGTDRKALQIWATLLHQKRLLIAKRVWFY